MAQMVFNNTQEMLKYTKNITAKSLDVLGEALQDEFSDEAISSGFSLMGVGSPLAYKVDIGYIPRLGISVEYSEEDIPHDDTAYGGTGWYSNSWDLNADAWHHTSPSGNHPKNLLDILKRGNVREFVRGKPDDERGGAFTVDRVFANQSGMLVDPDFFDRVANDRPRLRSLCRRTLLDVGLPIV